MSGLSRRDLLRASAGAAAVAVPMSVLSHQGSASAAPSSAAAGTAAAAAAEAAEIDRLVGPVMFSIRDAASGEVSILHGSSEVVVHDRQLVDRIVRAARRTL